MKLLGSTKDIIDSDENSENVPKLENVEVFLVHCNLVNNSYQQASRVLFTFVPNKQYGQLISISPKSLIFLKTMNTEFSEIEIWFTDQNNNSLEIEDNVNYVQGQGFMLFARNIGHKYGKKIFDKSLDVGKSMKKIWLKNIR